MRHLMCVLKERGITSPKSLLAMVLILCCPVIFSGCVVAGLVSVLGQSAEYQKLIEVPAVYSGLQDQSIAVVVDADYSVLFQHPDVVSKIMAGVSARINRDVPGARILPPQAVMAWQYTTPQWTSLPFDEMARSLTVDRVVYITIFEYRLNPAGNSWMWEGVCDADIGIIERDSYDVDNFTEMLHITSSFPNVTGLDRDSAQGTYIEHGLLVKFVRDVTWLFHDHTEPKHPDQYRPGA